MTEKQFIEKAIEGGWEPYRDSFLDPDERGKAPKPSSIEITDINTNENDYDFPSTMIVLKWYDEEGTDNEELGYSLYETLLRPEVWRAVGKVEGWKGEKIRMCVGCGVALKWNEKETMDGKHGGKNGCGSDIEEYEGQWLIEMHRMIDALADGKSIKEFLKTL